MTLKREKSLINWKERRIKKKVYIRPNFSFVRYKKNHTHNNNIYQMQNPPNRWTKKTQKKSLDSLAGCTPVSYDRINISIGRRTYELNPGLLCPGTWFSNWKSWGEWETAILTTRLQRIVFLMYASNGMYLINLWPCRFCIPYLQKSRYIFWNSQGGL